MKKTLFIILSCWIIPTILFAQLKKQNTPLNIQNEITKPKENNFIGLNLSRLHISHSYSVSFSSIGGKGITESLYLNTMSYQISDPLSLKLQWGIKNYPYNSFTKDHPAFQDGFFFSGAELKYQPSDKFFMKFQYNALPRYNYYSYPYYYNRLWQDED